MSTGSPAYLSQPSQERGEQTSLRLSSGLHQRRQCERLSQFQQFVPWTIPAKKRRSLSECLETTNLERMLCGTLTQLVPQRCGIRGPFKAVRPQPPAISHLAGYCTEDADTDARCLLQRQQVSQIHEIYSPGLFFGRVRATLDGAFSFHKAYFISVTAGLLGCFGSKIPTLMPHEVEKSLSLIALIISLHVVCFLLSRSAADSWQ